MKINVPFQKYMLYYTRFYVSIEDMPMKKFNLLKTAQLAAFIGLLYLKIVQKRNY